MGAAIYTTNKNMVAVFLTISKFVLGVELASFFSTCHIEEMSRNRRLASVKIRQNTHVF